MYTQGVEFGAQIAKQTSKNGASVVEAGAQAGEMVRESIFESGVEGASVVEAGAQAGEMVRESIFESGVEGASVVEAGAQVGEEVREMFGKKDEGLLDKIGNFFAGGGLVGMGAKFGESLRNKILN